MRMRTRSECVRPVVIKRISARPLCSMAAVGYRPTDIAPTYYGRADSKAAAMAWVAQVFENKCIPLPYLIFPLAHPFSS